LDKELRFQRELEGEYELLYVKGNSGQKQLSEEDTLSLGGTLRALAEEDESWRPAEITFRQTQIIECYAERCIIDDQEYQVPNDQPLN